MRVRAPRVTTTVNAGGDDTPPPLRALAPSRLDCSRGAARRGRRGALRRGERERREKNREGARPHYTCRRVFQVSLGDCLFFFFDLQNVFIVFLSIVVCNRLLTE